MTQNGEGIKLELILKPNGDISLTGPIENKVLCFGILELARNALHTYRPGSAPQVPVDLLKPLGPNGK